MIWVEVTNQADLDMLMDTFGAFHDACIKEFHLWTESYVGNDLSMSCPSHLDNHVRLLIQRQFRDPSAIELLFDQVRHINVAPSPDNYDSIIFDATLLLQDSVFYWANVGRWLPDQEDSMNTTWIAANKLKWRDASEWMGEELRYGPQETTTSG